MAEVACWWEIESSSKLIFTRIPRGAQKDFRKGFRRHRHNTYDRGLPRGRSTKGRWVVQHIIELSFACQTQEGGAIRGLSLL